MSTTHIRIGEGAVPSVGACNFCTRTRADYRYVMVLQSETPGLLVRLCPHCQEAVKAHLTRRPGGPRHLEASAFSDAVLLMVHNGLNIAQSTAIVAFGSDHPTVTRLRALSQLVLAVNQGAWDTARSQLDAIVGARS